MAILLFILLFSGDCFLTTVLKFFQTFLRLDLQGSVSCQVLLNIRVVQGKLQLLSACWIRLVAHLS